MENNDYLVMCINDGTDVWKKRFDNAIDAVDCYERFVDHGFCNSERIVTLVEPNGKYHTKIFRNPALAGVH